MVDPRVARSKGRIVTALVALLQTRDLESVTVRDITDGSEVGYTTFYRHYVSKESVFTELAEGEVAALTDLAFPQVVEQPGLHAAMSAARHIASRRPQWVAVTSRGGTSILREKLIDAMLRHAEGLPMGSDLLPRTMTAALAATILIEVLGWWLREHQSGSPELLAQAIDRTIIQPALNSW